MVNKGQHFGDRIGPRLQVKIITSDIQNSQIQTKVKQIFKNYDLDWNHLVQDRVQWWQPGEMVMDHRVSHSEERFLKSWVTVSFWRRPQHHRVINYSRKRTMNFLCVTPVKRWILSPYRQSITPADTSRLYYSYAFLYFR